MEKKVTTLSGIGFRNFRGTTFFPVGPPPVGNGDSVVFWLWTLPFFGVRWWCLLEHENFVGSNFFFNVGWKNKMLVGKKTCRL